MNEEIGQISNGRRSDEIRIQREAEDHRREMEELEQSQDRAREEGKGDTIDMYA